MKINYLDLFSGIGGFALGFKQAGWEFDKHYFSEIDKYAIQIYTKHFPEAIAVGDVSKVDGTKLGRIDLITFGFPCQDLSIAGKRAGLAGSRSGLFYEATRLIRECKPGIFIFENVKGLLTSNKGEDFEECLREIADIGLYECEWQLVNTSWVLPQNRERIYFIGHIGGKCGRKVFPIGEGDTELIELQRKAGKERQGIPSELSEAGRSEECAEGRRGGQGRFDSTLNNPQALRVHEPNGNSVTLAGEGGAWVQGQDYMQLKIKEATKQGYAIAKEGDSINLSQPNSKTRRGRVGGVWQIL